MEAECVTLCVIDDCLDSDVPLLEVSLNDLQVEQVSASILNETILTGLVAYIQNYTFLVKEINPVKIVSLKICNNRDIQRTC